MISSNFVSIIIVNFNGLRYTRLCLESLYQFHNPETIEVIVVDNNSSDGSQAELPKLFPSIKFISLSANMGFGAANNIGAKISKGENLFFVNNDTLFIEETVEKLQNYLLSNNNYGIISPKLLNKDGTFQLSFGSFPTIINEFNTKKISKNYSLKINKNIATQLIEKDWVTGAALMIR